jgi:hypothetical protein
MVELRSIHAVQKVRATKYIGDSSQEFEFKNELEGYSYTAHSFYDYRMERALEYSSIRDPKSLAKFSQYVLSRHNNSPEAIKMVYEIFPLSNYIESEVRDTFETPHGVYSGIWVLIYFRDCRTLPHQSLCSP